MEISTYSVVIATIGRDSINKTLESIPEKYPVIVSIDCKGKVPNITRKNTTILDSGVHGCGFVKQAGIDRVETKYFGLLDDDDFYFGEAPLVKALNLMEKENLDYLINSVSLPLDKIYFLDKKLFSEMLYEFDKYSTKYLEDHIYIGGPTLYRTEFMRANKLSFARELTDDTVPCIKAGLIGNGAVIGNPLISITSTPGSLSRKAIPLKDQMGNITELIECAYNSSDLIEFNTWIKAIRNHLLGSKYNEGAPLK